MKELGEGDDEPGGESAVWVAAEEARCGGLGLFGGAARFSETRPETSHHKKMSFQFVVGDAAGGQEVLHPSGGWTNFTNLSHRFGFCLLGWMV